jgi:hypothetical protein
VGLFFDNRASSSDLVDLIQKVLNADPNQPSALDEAKQQATTLASKLQPLMQTPTNAPAEEKPASPAPASPAPASPAPASPAPVSRQATKAAQATANQLLGGPSFNTGRFWIALAIFAALVGGAIATEATHLGTASGTLFGFAGAVFGIVTAFLGSEKGSG